MNGGDTMSNEERKKEAAAQMWLRYFNDHLFRQGVITEKERNQMILLLDREARRLNAEDSLS